MNAPRKPWIALALSLAATGAGHIYCGRVVRGATLFASWFLVLATAFLADSERAAHHDRSVWFVRKRRDEAADLRALRG